MTKKENLKNHLKQVLSAQGDSLADAAESVARYTADQAEALSKAYGKPGFSYAVKAAAHNVMLRASIVSVEEADEVDTRLLKVVESLISFGAAILIGAL